mgnify:CR=1 FL=1
MRHGVAVSSAPTRGPSCLAVPSISSASSPPSAPLPSTPPPLTCRCGRVGGGVQGVAGRPHAVRVQDSRVAGAPALAAAVCGGGATGRGRIRRGGRRSVCVGVRRPQRERGIGCVESSCQSRLQWPLARADRPEARPLPVRPHLPLRKRSCCVSCATQTLCSGRGSASQVRLPARLPACAAAQQQQQQQQQQPRAAGVRGARAS